MSDKTPSKRRAPEPSPAPGDARMNPSTDGVTIYSGFIADLLKIFEDRREEMAPLFALGADYDGLTEHRQVPIRAYNDVCQWIEDFIGVGAIIQAGVVLGERIVGNLRSMGQLEGEVSGHRMMSLLAEIATGMIDDPLERGWEILDVHDHGLFMRRTQTFNCMLQQGLITGLLRRTTARFPLCRQVRCVRLGDPFCLYEVQWRSNPSATSQH